MKFINQKNMNKDKREYGANNVCHCFSRTMYYPEFLNGLSEKERKDYGIKNYTIKDFMLGNEKEGSVKDHKYFHLPMPIHFVIKHQNQGKIDSHLWFFKGFCDYLNPIFTQIIDCGSIPMWNSVSYLIKHMTKFQKVSFVQFLS